MASQKLIWIDVIKGIGILSVVAGHIFQGLTKEIIFMFHMPLFFFISGYLYTVKDNRVAYFLDKVYHLVVPYIAFLILLYVPILVAAGIAGHINLKLLLNPIIGGRALSGALGVFWFVTCLFVTQQMMNWLLSKFSVHVVGVLMLAFLAVSYVNALLFPEFWLPGNINVVFAACPFFYAGYLARSLVIKRFAFVYLLLAGLALALPLAGLENAYDMKYADYGIPGISLISALSMIGIIFVIAEAIAKYRVGHLIFTKMGEASMVVMFLHQPLQLGLLAYGDVSSPFIRFFVAAFVPVVVYQVLQNYGYMRALFLGSKADFKQYIFKRTGEVGGEKAGASSASVR